MLRALIAVAVLLPLSAAAQKIEVPPKIQAILDEGRRQLQDEAFTKAEATFKRATEQHPGNPILWNELGVATFQRNAPAAAIPAFRKAVKLDPKFAHAWANLAEAQRQAKRYKQAALSFHKFLQLRKGDRYGVYGLGLAFEGYESFDKALKTLQVAERAAANDKRLLARVNRAIKRVQRKMAEAKLSYLDRGDARLAAGEWAEALQLYEKGLKKKKGDAALLGRRGIVKAILGDVAAARSDLKAALLKAPGDEIIRGAYVLLLDYEGAPDPTPAAGTDHGGGMLGADRAALAWRAFAAELAAGTAAARAKRGEAALRLGLLGDAEEDFAGGGDDPALALGRAELHWIRGQEAEAEEEAGVLPGSVKDLPVWRRSLLAD